MKNCFKDWSQSSYWLEHIRGNDVALLKDANVKNHIQDQSQIGLKIVEEP